MGWLRVVGSLKLHVSFAKESYKRDDILEKRPTILRSLLIIATPYQKLHQETPLRATQLSPVCLTAERLAYTDIVNVILGHTPCHKKQSIRSCRASWYHALGKRDYTTKLPLPLIQTCATRPHVAVYLCICDAPIPSCCS